MPHGGAGDGQGATVSMARLRTGPGYVVAAWPARGRRRRPLAIIVHGLLGRPENHVDWLFETARRGVVAISLEAAYAQTRDGVRTRLASAFFESLDALVRETARSIGEVVEELGGFRGADTGRVGVVGISAGGLAALRAAVELPYVAAVAAALSGPGWCQPPERLDPELQAELGFEPPPLRPALPFEPAHYPGLHAGWVMERVGALQGRAVLLAVGGQDALFPQEPARALYRRLAEADPSGSQGGRVQLVVYPGLGHRVTPALKQRLSSWLVWMLSGRQTASEREGGRAVHRD